ncbi:hypothetical protein OAU50_04325 [Planctomycetota bacterium]|nr:hypothetical protein [Planctomycetota bacterium]
MTTEIDKPQQLEPVQVIAIRELLAGSTITAAARAAKVDRATLSQWVNSPGLFRDVYQDARAELWDEMRSSMARAVDKSVRVVLESLEGPNPDRKLKAALAVLRMLKFDSSDVRPHSAAEKDEDEKISVLMDKADHREHAAFLDAEDWPG